ncbi:MAG: SDR family NAD(P)-dependent oxidoreductase [Hyphomicrobiales bacterium]
MPERASEIFDVSGEVILVTGASSGLGRRFARVLGMNGAKVALAGRRKDRLEEVASELTGYTRTVVLPFDVTDREAANQAFDRIESELGPVTVAVNNAGIAGEGAAIDIDYDRWRQILNVDLDSVFAIAQEAARRMGTRGGNIINVSSILGLRPGKNLAAYSVAKAGVVQLTRVMALELAPRGIRVNTLAPGYVVTAMNREFFESPRSEVVLRAIPMRRVGQVEEFDGAILFLASKASRFMTGATLVIDGGHTMVM